VITSAILDVTMEDLISVTIEQLNSIIQLHEEDEEATVQLKSLLQDLIKLKGCLENLYQLFSSKDWSPPAVLNECHVISNILTSIYEQVASVTVGLNDESLVCTMNSYVESVKHFSLQFQLSVLAYIWDIRIQGYESIKFVGFIKDFSFVTFPFLYNFKDASIIINESNL